MWLKHNFHTTFGKYCNGNGSWDITLTLQIWWVKTILHLILQSKQWPLIHLDILLTHEQILKSLGQDSFKQLCDFSHKDFLSYWNQLRNNRQIPGVSPTEITLVQPNTWDWCTIEALKILLHGRVVFPPEIKAAWPQHCSFTGLMNINHDLRAEIASMYGVVISKSCFNGAGEGLFCGKGETLFIPTRNYMNIKTNIFK